MKTLIEGKKGLYLLLFISLSIKVITVACSDMVNNDGTIYISAAQEFAEGNFKEGLSLYPMPFYPLMIMISHWFIPQWVLAGQTISLLALGFAVVPLYMTIRILFGESSAFWGGMVFAVAPWFNYLAADVLRDPVFIFFISWALYFSTSVISQHRARHYILASLACLLAFLCRIEAAVFPLVFLFVLLVLAIRNRNERIFYLKGIAYFLAVPAIFLIIFYPVFGREMVSFNRLMDIFIHFETFFKLYFLQNYLNIYEQLKDLERTMPGWSWSRSFSEITRHNLWLIYLLGLFQGIFKILFPFTFIPLVAGFIGRPRLNRTHFLLLALIFIYVMGAYQYHVKMNFIDSRYLIMPSLLFLPWIGLGISLFFNRALHASRPWLAALSLILIFVIVPLGKSLDVIVREEDDASKQAGLWLSRQSSSNEFSMICTDSRVPFYSGHGMDYNLYSNSDYGEMEQIGINGEYDLLIIHDAKKRVTQPPAFEHYEIWKMHEGHKNIALIYRKKS